MNAAIQVHGMRPFVLLMTGCMLLLVALLEALFLSVHATELILATLFGIPVGWLLLCLASRVLKKTAMLDVFSPLAAFPIIYILWFGLGSLTFWWDSNPPHYGYFVLGLAGYLAGGLTILRKRHAVPEMLRSPERVPWIGTKFRLVVLGLFVSMVCAYLLLVAQIGIPAIHSDVAFRREALGEHHYLIAALQSSAMTVMFFAAADLWSVERLFPPIASGGMLGLGALMLGSFGNRGFLVVPILTLLILWHYWRRTIAAGRLIVMFAAVFAIAVGYDYVRASATVDDLGIYAWSEVLYSSATFMLHTNLSNFRDIVQAIPSEVPYQHGYLTFGALLQILPGHHESSDLFFKRILASDFLGGGQPGTLLAPLYGDFGVVGIAAGMFLFGVFSAKAYVWMRRGPTLFKALIYSWVVQTALLSVYGALVTYFITLWLPFLWWVLNRWMRVAPGLIGRDN